MSELIAEARVLVTPDTTTFRALLTSQLAAATAGQTVKIPVTPVVTGASGISTAAAASRDLGAAERSTAEAISGATQEKQRAIGATRSYTTRLQGLSSGAASAGLSLVGLRGATLAATGPFLAGAAAAISLGKALQIATSFTSELSVFAAVTGATAEEMERVSQASRELGRDISLPGVTAGDAAKTMTEFAKAGLTVNDAIAATRGGLQLATAAQLSYEDAVQLSANALNAFNLQGDQAVHVADVLANAANLAQGGIADTALALRQAAGAAAVVGVSFEDTAALLTLLARNGLTGSDAGTALRTAFLRLVNPSEEAKDVLASLNVELRDLEGNVRPEIFADFAAAQAGLAKSTQQANAAIVFGQDAFRAFGFLGREGAAGLNEVQRGLEQTGTASRVANARMVGLTGATANLTNQLSDLGLTVGKIVTPPVQFFVEQLAGFVSIANEAARGAEALAQEFKDVADAIDQLPGAGADNFLFNRIEDIVKFSPSTPLGIKNIFNEIKGVFDDGAKDVDEGGDKVRDAIIDAARKGEQATFGFSRIAPAIRAHLADVASAASQLALDLDVARARGNEGAELAILRQQESGQERFLNRVLQRPQNAKNVELARKAAQQLDQTRAAIEAIVEGQAAAAKTTATKITQSASAADSAVLQALANARSRQENAIAQAEQTAGANDDIRETTQLRALIIRQIAVIRSQVGDEKVKAAAITALVAAKIATTAALKRLRDAAKDEREQAAQERRDQLEENLALRTQIAEARGNESAILKRLNAQIAFQRKEVAAAKNLNDRLTETLKLEELLRKKRELIAKERDADAQSGTTAFDLLTQAAARFTGGNIIGAAQPFAGPTEFTADLSQFLRRNATTSTAPVASKSPFAGFTGSADRLVEAINRNTAALNGGEAGPPVRKGKRPPVSKAVGNTFRGWWQFADEARDQVEGAG